MDTTSTNLLRQRINENLLKVKNESSQVKGLLSLGVQSARQSEYNYNSAHSSVNDELNTHARFTKRKDLLRTSILLATSRNTEAQQNLIDVISLRLGRIKDKDYKYIAEILRSRTYHDQHIVDRINKFLCINLDGFAEMHKKYYKHYYGF